MKPEEIEQRSMEIIEQELQAAGISLPQDYAPIIKRCIHTSADFDYADNLVFSEHSVEKGIAAIKRGAVIVTDTQMAKAGINQRVLERYGGKVLCFIGDLDVAKEAARNGTTRSAEALKKAASLSGPLIFAIGNAPTALMKLTELVIAGQVKPELIIGVPVGFVNVVSSKEELLTLAVPHITARGRKGGSTIAACICNGLLYMV